MVNTQQTFLSSPSSHLTGEEMKEIARLEYESRFVFFFNPADAPCLHGPKDDSYSL